MIHSRDKNNNELLSIYNISLKNYIKSIHINDLGKIYEISNSDFSNILYVNEKYIKLINTTEEKNGINPLASPSAGAPALKFQGEKTFLFVKFIL